MRILYLTQYFPPEVGATQSRAYEMAKGLVQAGHEVTVLTELPNHPSGVMRPEFRRRVLTRNNEEGIEVIRVWVKASRSKSFAGRLFFYASYSLMATLAGIVAARGGYDVIYASSPPLFTGLAALVVRFFKQIPLVLEIRDLWPESAVELGALRSRSAVRAATWLARRCYQRSRRIVVVTKGIHQRLVQLGIPDRKLVLIPNGANTELYQPDGPGASAVRRHLELGESFVVACAGTLAIAYNFETVLQAAHQLRDTSVVFLMAGSGPQEAPTKDMARELRLPNVRFLGEIPYAELPSYLSAANVSVIPLRRLPLFDGALPVRLFDSWACGCPAVVPAFTEIREVGDAAGAALYVPAEDADALAATIRNLTGQVAHLQEMGASGRAYVRKNFSRAAQATRLARLLEEAIC